MVIKGERELGTDKLGVWDEQIQTTIYKIDRQDFPTGTVVKKPPANAGDMGSSPGLGRSHMPRSN